MSEAKRAIEAILMVADGPAEPGLLAQLLEVSPARIDELCAELTQSYVDEDRGFVLVRVAGGYRLQTHPDLAPYVERFVLEGQTARLSAAALETLAIVAYKQPVSRAQISAIRGVNADGVLRTLEQRGYVGVLGHDPGPGQAALYGTTTVFLERLGLDRIEDLPPLAGFVPGPEVMDALEQGLRANIVDRASPSPGVDDPAAGPDRSEGDAPNGGDGEAAEEDGEASEEPDASDDNDASPWAYPGADPSSEPGAGEDEASPEDPPAGE